MLYPTSHREQQPLSRCWTIEHRDAVGVCFCFGRAATSKALTRSKNTSDRTNFCDTFRDNFFDIRVILLINVSILSTMGNRLCKKKSDVVDNAKSVSSREGTPSKFDRIFNRLHVSVDFDWSLYKHIYYTFNLNANKTGFMFLSYCLFMNH